MIAIIVDNLDIGGIQRFALDECYALDEANEEYCLLVLSNRKPNSILDVDREYLGDNELNIQYMGDNLVNKTINLYKFILRNNPKKFVSHSVSATAILRVISVSMLRNQKIYLWIHQAITLSDPFQATKRIIYSNFASKLFFGAKHFESEWIKYLDERSFLKIFFLKQTHFSRLGVYLPRVLSSRYSELRINDNYSIIFASRLTNWKGFDKFLEIANLEAFRDFNQIVLTSNDWNSTVFVETQSLQANLYFQTNISPAALRNLQNSVHIYPTDYGLSTKFPQSIGLNVLEFLVLGIPSLISIESFETYPELKESILISTCDWSNQEDIINKVNSMVTLDIEEIIRESVKLRKVVSIDNHLSVILDRQGVKFD